MDNPADKGIAELVDIEAAVTANDADLGERLSQAIEPMVKELLDLRLAIEKASAQAKKLTAALHAATEDRH